MDQGHPQTRAPVVGRGVHKTRAKDPIVPPSDASGGVPEPSSTYLATTLEPSVRQGSPQPLLVVVDLNGTLLHRPDRARAPKVFVGRPHAASFFSYCIRTFWVVVWSSAAPRNVHSLCHQLLSASELRDTVAVWGRDRFGLTPSDYAQRVQCYKRLTMLWDDPDVARSHPHYAQGGRWSQRNTILIDDSLEKARAEPHNAIIVPSFENAPGSVEDVLPRVHDYLNELCFESNVSSYMRQHPLKLGCA